MNVDSPLAKAHALAGQASTLLKSPSTASRRQAVKAYDEAADLFESEKATVADDETAQTTLRLLMTQNRKQARDLERRLNAEALSRPQGSVGSNGIGSLIPSPSIERTLLQAASREQPGIGTTTHQQPPFAQRPTVTRNEVPSPLYSSTSSSDHADDSFIHFGGHPDTTDPFARFWGVLETMLDDISNPVAFTSVPLGVGTDPESSQQRSPAIPRPRKASKRDKTKDRHPGTESFYIVPSSSEPLKAEHPVVKEPTPKTHEELALENESLRASLDALSKHAQAISIENAQLRGGAEKREEMMKSVVLGVRREAQKAMQGQQDLIARSQMLGSLSSNASPWNARSPALAKAVVAEGDPAPALKRRVRELEEEVKISRVENEKQRAQLEKYREKFDKLKTHAKEKREAKLKLANGATKA